MGALLGARDLRELAAGIDLRPSKQRGQNFVHDANTVRRIVAAAGVGDADTVLEIGPGLGSLTMGLLEAGASVVAIEVDQALATLLPQTVARRMPDAASRLSVITADALQVRELPNSPSAMVANLPYNISVPVILHILGQFPGIRSGLVMVQAEVADRLAAPPGSRVYGIPSAKLAWYASARRVGSVPPNVFWPVPRVESGLVEIIRRDPPATSATKEQVFTVVDRAFSARRKMLRSNLAGLADSPAAVLQAAGVDPAARGETLGITDFSAIAEEVFS
ncbi:MAG: 16S rRNA (adenine(1518)-N(6)/adenine(1519)-N(6))-dimethyltransferase RsmA [Propionibacteriaceae bacterium]|nr:16S rRNA (adenine(1518)-N(6)/adenine(1519)-N(6))-dimethyltransferase RsmA [Propionibacteriaceae bacterium]